MANVKVQNGRASAVNTGGEQNITIPGFGDPVQAGIILATPADLDGVSGKRTYAGFSQGFFTAPPGIFAAGGQGIFYEGATNPAGVLRFSGISPILLSSDADVFIEQNVRLNNQIPDGIELGNNSLFPTPEPMYSFSFFGGDDVKSAIIKGSTPATPGVLPFHTLTFEPQLIFILSTLSASIDYVGGPNVLSDFAAMSKGMVHNNGVGGITHRSNSWFGSDPGSTTHSFNTSSTFCLMGIDATGTNQRITLENFDGTGFDMRENVSSAGAVPFMALCLSFGSLAKSKVGHIVTNVASGIELFADPGFESQWLFMEPTNQTVHSVSVDITDQFTIASGMVDAGMNEFGQSASTESGLAGVSNAESRAESEVVLLPDDDGVTNLEGALNNFIGNGFLMNWVAGGGAQIINYATVEVEPPEGPSMVKNRVLTALKSDLSALDAIVPGDTISGFPALLNSTTAVTTPVVTSAAIILSCDMPVHVKFSTAGTAAVQTDLFLPAGFYVFPIIEGGDNRVSVIEAAAGAANCHIHEAQTL